MIMETKPYVHRFGICCGGTVSPRRTPTAVTIRVVVVVTAVAVVVGKIAACGEDVADAVIVLRLIR